MIQVITGQSVEHFTLLSRWLFLKKWNRLVAVHHKFQINSIWFESLFLHFEGTMKLYNANYYIIKIIKKNYNKNN